MIEELVMQTITCESCGKKKKQEISDNFLTWFEVIYRYSHLDNDVCSGHACSVECVAKVAKKLKAQGDSNKI